MFVISPNERPELEDYLTSFANWDRGVTIRFSHAYDLGLPRAFVRSKHEAKSFIDRTWRSGWTLIIHEYIDVVSSFELLVANDTAALEHVPGMWESHSNVAPDYLSITREHVSAWRFKAARVGEFAELTGHKVSKRQVRPLDPDMLRSWANRFASIAVRIRRDFGDQLPMNLHCVADSLGTWQFLNIRRGFDVPTPKLYEGWAHSVSSLHDLSLWDRTSPILLRVSTSRGKERALLELARRLPKTGTDIYIDFGVLSHPAMVLREYGLTLIPGYNLRQRRSVQQYEHEEWEMSGT
jgi:hypothetical protein